MQAHALSWLVFYLVLASFRFSEAIKTIIVDQFGKGNFGKLQDAINSVPSQNKDWIHIKINPGIYKEKVTIPADRGYIFLDGGDYHKTMISWNDYGQANLAATFKVSADNFVAKGITFINTYGRQPPLGTFAPAVAASVGGDKSAFYGCAFIGYQDTLLDDQGRHYYTSCYIEGAVDFIWGFGQSFFEDCTINVTAGLQSKNVYQAQGYITAQGRQSTSDSSGFVFEKGSISGKGLSYLGRAYGPYSRVIFHGTNMGNVINPLGWHPWGQNVTNLYNAEVGCTGQGANTTGRVKWDRTNLNDMQLQPFLRKNFVDSDGWIENQPIKLV